ncbi:TRAP transporter permease [Pelovirga terrestris]|uniref:TRAP transporter permease n=1 Tax=Pelovirga terrestris TaxID=2771352 RepID=A0A8J6QX38_9BACT|nr:TRAP transporter permease [Pelovirga terrestris]MBD1399807.1 TRAP transporter permease [Pelovirga terrestris]
MSDTLATSTLNDKLKKVMAETEGGARNPTGAVPKKILFFVPLFWSLFQLWYASPLPYLFNVFVLNDTQARSIHLAFAMFLAYTAFPTLKSSPSKYIPVQDWIIALIAAFCAGYLYLFNAELSIRPGSPTTMDLVVAIIGMVLMLEATRRALGPPLMVVGTIFVIYTFGGQYMPDIIAHKGASFAKGMSHYWLGTEGVFGVALGVSAGMVFMFVLFGALLEKAGAGNYFIRTSFAALGHFRGGPAKAAVVASGLTGMCSGSSIANVVTTGTFTIPLMKKVGFRAEKAGAIEVACSTNGQLMPPVMGAAAFLMVEYVGISYIEVIKHAFLPAVISYIALFYIVHIEACKMGLEGMKRPIVTSFMRKIFTFATAIVLLLVITVVTYYGLGWIKIVAGDGAFYIVIAILLVAYLLLLWFACKVPDLELTTEIKELPPLKETAQAGYYFLLPIVVLMWCLVVERLSPALSAYWATMLMIFILLTQRPLKGYFRKAKGENYSVFTGATDLINGLVAGARNMIGIGVATAAAGIVVGTVTLTGIGLVMTEFVEFISGGSLMLVLLFTAIISLLLGMGLPTTANYIVVSTLMAPVVVELGAQNGLIVPLIAVHLFVFYFGILADDTPPVGLAAFAAAGISGGDPIRTGIQGFTYDMRTAILPFMFIFNNQLLLIGLTGWFHLIIVIITALIAMLCFAAGTQGYMLTRNRKWESALLLLIAIGLFRPGIIWDRLYPPLMEEPPSELAVWIGDMESGEALRLTLKGERLSGREYTKAIMLTVGNETTGAERLAALGIETIEIDGRIFVDMVAFASPAARAGIDFDQEILNFQVPTDRPPKELLYIPILGALAGVVILQFRRRKKQQLASG